MPSYIATGDHFSPQIVEEKKKSTLVNALIWCLWFPKGSNSNALQGRYLFSVLWHPIYLCICCASYLFLIPANQSRCYHGSIFSRGCVYICYRDLTWHSCGVVWAAFLKLSSLCLLLQLKVHRAGGHEGAADVNGKRSGQAGTHKHEWSWTEICVHYCCL